MKVFLDTNVIMDVLLEGRPMHEASDLIMRLRISDGIKLYTSSLSIADAAYLTRKSYTLSEWKNIARGMLDRLKVLTLSDFDIYLACKSDCPVFEDAMQISIAETECDIIVTNNVGHFVPYTCLPVMTPADFLSRLSGDAE